MKKLTALLLTAALLLTISCSDSSTEPKPTANPVQEFESQTGTVNSDMNEMMATTSVTAMTANMGALQQLPFMGSGKDKVLSALSGFKKYDSKNMLAFLPVSQNVKRDAIPFDFSSHCGTYNWNSQLQQWDVTTGGTSIVVNFPATATSTTNNAVFTWSKYAEALVNLEIPGESTVEQVYMPTEMEMDFKINGTTEAALDFSAAYRNNGIPSAMSLDLLLNPFTLYASMTSQEKQIDMTLKLKKAAAELYNLSVNLKFLDTNYEVIDDVTATLSRGDLTFYAFGNVDALANLEVNSNEEMIAALNNKTNLDCQIKVSGNKVADLRFKLVTSGTNPVYETMMPYFLFTNGTEMSIAELMNKLFPQGTLK